MIAMETVRVTSEGKRQLAPEYLTKEYYEQHIKADPVVIVSEVTDEMIEELAALLINNVGQ